MKYSDFLNVLNAEKEDEFAEFQRKLIPTSQKILGVRTPVMRKIAKAYTGDVDELFSYPDEYFEVTFIKLTVVSSLPYERFLRYLDQSVSLIDNWATCDCFKAKCVKRHKDEFLPVLERLFQTEKEFAQRYVLVVLLGDYVEEKYLPILEEYLRRAQTKPYYVHMGAAWLMAEILVKYYGFGVEILKKGILERRTHNKAIAKATESYRLTNEQKEYLRSLKIKK